METFNANDFLFYCGKGNRPLGLRTLEILGEYLGTPPLKFVYLDFGVWRDGCSNDKLPDYKNISGKNIVFFDSLYTKETMFDYLQLAMAFRKQYEAKKLLAVIPFLLPRRCDHEEPEYNFEINYLSQYMEQMAFCGTTNLIVGTPHSEAIARHCEHLNIKFMPAYMDFSPTIKAIVPEGGKKLIFYSPDEGSIPRAIAHAKNISGSRVVFDLKARHKNNKTDIVNDEELAASIIKKYQKAFNYEFISHASPENIAGMNIVMIEDELSSGDTANKTANKLRQLGAKSVYLAFVHPVCVNGWKITLFHNNPFTRVLAGDTIIRNESNRTGGSVVDVSIAESLAATTYQMLMDM